MSIKIYFAGSIRGGRDSASDYMLIISKLQRVGTVLTEHIADDTLLLNEKQLTDEQIHHRDLEWLKECNCVVAEVTQPSLGVGYELAYAMFLKKAVLCLFNRSKGKNLSAMIAGQKYFQVVSYQNREEANKIIQEYFETNSFEQT